MRVRGLIEAASGQPTSWSMMMFPRMRVRGLIEARGDVGHYARAIWFPRMRVRGLIEASWREQDRKSTRLNSSHVAISYAVFCLKKKNTKIVTKIYTGTLML